MLEDNNKKIINFFLKERYTDVVEAYQAGQGKFDGVVLTIVARSAVELGQTDYARQIMGELPADLSFEDTFDTWLRIGLAEPDLALVKRCVHEVEATNNSLDVRFAKEIIRFLFKYVAWGTVYRVLSLIEVAANNDHCFFQYVRGLLSLRRRDYGEALEAATGAYQRASEEEVLQAAALLARCYEATGHLTQATAVYRDTLRNAAPHGRYHYWAAITAVKAGRFPLAREMAIKAQSAGAQGPWMDWVHGYLRLRMQSRPSAALHTFESCLKARPYNATFIIAWLDAYEAKHDPAATLERLQKLSGRVDHPTLRHREIELLQALNRVDDAKAAVREARETFPSDQALRELEDRLAGSVAADDDAEEEVQSTAGRQPGAQRAFYQVAAANSSGRQGVPTPQAALPSIFQPRWSDGTLNPSVSYRVAAAGQGRVLLALFLREIQTRFGRAKLGYLWAFIEPALHISVFYILWSFRGIGTMENMPLLLFLVTGFIPFFTFSIGYAQCVGAVKSYSSLLTHPGITPLDIIFVKTILEVLTRITVFFTFLALLWLAGVQFLFPDLLNVLSCFTILWALGAGLGLVIESFSSIVATLPKVMTMAVRLLYFTSGVMFSVQSLPQDVQTILNWNPLLHVITMMRHAFRQVEPGAEYTFVYPAFVAVGMVTFGLVALRALQRRITAA